MDRHRKMINDQRALIGLPELERGPRYTVEQEAEQCARRDGMNQRQNPFSSSFVMIEVQNTNQMVPYVFPVETTNGLGAETANTILRNPLHSQLISRPISDLNDIVSAQEQTVLVVPSHANRITPSTAETFEERSLSSVLRDTTSQEDQAMAFENTQGELEIDMTEEALLPVEAPATFMRSHAYIRFRQWANEEREWVKAFVEFGITERLMTRVLNLKGAPLTPVTLKRDLSKYSGFVSVKYVTCNGHMLIGGELSDVQPEERQCTVCSEANISPRYSTFEYFELLPRLLSWVQNEQSCRLLFSYRHEQILERSKASASFGPGAFYADVIDGELFRRIALSNGGIYGTAYDVTLAVSCDGFQTFANKSYDCWPIVALNHNLPPTMRFLIHNLVPLGFIKGPKEPVRLDTFLTPLLDEVISINEGGGTEMMFFDEVQRRVRVHIVLVTGDSPAIAKLAGTTGTNGKSSCRFCEHHGFYSGTSRHYYYPNKILVPQGEGRRSVWQQCYDIDQLRMRSEDSIETTFRIFEENPNMARSRREEIQKEMGIKQRTVTLKFPSIFPFISFPLDTMHLCMNICKDFTQILRGENSSLNTHTDSPDDFVIPRQGWHEIDKEIERIGTGTSLMTFGPVPRATAEYRQWKAAECRDFYRFFAVVLFDGYVSQVYLEGIQLLSSIIESCTWPTMTQADVVDLDTLARSFVKHFETRYFRYDPKRVSLCKSTIHALMHLARVVELCGPLVNVNQFWVERYVGVIKHRLNATVLAAESLTENAKFFECYKMYYDEHFACIESTEDNSQRDNAYAIDGIGLLSPCDLESLEDPFHIKMRTRKLLVDYVSASQQLEEEDGKKAVLESTIWSHGRVRITDGDSCQTFGAARSRRHRKELKRADWYVSCEFAASENDRELVIYYGRLLKVLRYEFQLPTERKEMALVMVDWATNLHMNRTGQVYKACPLKRSFTKPTVESASVLSSSIGVLEHRAPGHREPRTFFVDPSREVNFVLHPTRTGPDGQKRLMAVLRTERRRGRR